MDKKIVSVIIPNYNHAKFLKQRIDSVLEQTFQNFELIILDDSSLDNSKEIIEVYRTHPKVSQIIYNFENSGSPFKQWQKGIELSEGDYVWIAESDDWAHPEFLEILTKSINENENVGICFSDSHWVDAEGKIGQDLSLYKSSFTVDGQQEIRKSLMKFNSIQNASAALIKRSLASKFIYKCSSYKATGDWLLYLQVLMVSDLVYVGKKLNNFRWYHNNTSNKASANGLWIKEGIRVLADSGVSSMKFSSNEIFEIKKYWLDKAQSFPFVRRLTLKCYISFYFLIFKYQRAHFRLG